ncbi:MAG: Cell shape-determining protein MreC [Nitrospirae bacterium]|nr:MAG: putative cell shape-determining protein MreC [Nitrospira sp. OLB3]MBV6468821.1 Cell shape-determining protein MreC [Nitrospirota bacterium]MCE7964153.1 rod shape-determining protein MreC [Nitrospira sp. NTP2]MCK6494514.1 rod shape-determining protein MreC [Nitrospira sp.]MEB2336996.1 rod shape-determining protein MreC [Nitrospirales bacterium]
MALSRSTYGTRRLAIVLFAVLLATLLLLPSQSQRVLQYVGGPLGQVLTFPLSIFSSVDHGLSETWDGYVALQGMREENRQLRREVELLKGQNTQLRESLSATQRYETLLAFKQQLSSQTVAARVIGRDATNWYRGMILDKGESDGIRPEMGVVTPAGVVGRIVKTNARSSVVLLVTDPNNAVAGLVQRTRDEGIVEGTSHGRARLKYIPLLSRVQAGDHVVTSGLTGVFPRGLMVGTLMQVEKSEGDLFQTAELEPEVDLSKVEEVLIITAPYENAEAAQKLLQEIQGDRKKS